MSILLKVLTPAIRVMQNPSDKLGNLVSDSTKMQTNESFIHICNYFWADVCHWNGWAVKYQASRNVKNWISIFEFLDQSASSFGTWHFFEIADDDISFALQD